MPTTPNIVNMLGDTIYLEVDGVHQDWKTYRFDLDIQTPGKKTFVFRIKETVNKVSATAEENASQISESGEEDLPKCSPTHQDEDLVARENEPRNIAATECRLLKKFACNESTDTSSLFEYPLRTIAYLTRPITGSPQTVEEISEMVHKRARLY